MWLVADSGSTKTNWCLMRDHTVVHRIYTIGLNPNILSLERIRTELQLVLLPALRPFGSPEAIQQVFFYGSGCSDAAASATVLAALGAVFPQAELDVQHDLLGAARAAANREPALVCILGTGSSACVYNGADVIRTRGANGYLLADFGSGVDIGRRFLNRLLEGDLHPEVDRAFRLRYTASPLEYRHRVYHSDRPNYELAQLTHVVSEFRGDSTVYSVVETSFRDFLQQVLLPLHSRFGFPVWAVGSVAEYFRPMLEMVLREAGLTLAGVLADPLDGLVAYHRTRMPLQV
jgi:N-acetylglucosamine kinase-like BadF-type ATPase